MTEKVDERQEQLLRDLRSVLSKPSGRRVFWYLLEASGIYRSSFTGNSKTFYNIGWSDFGKFLMAAILRADRKSYSKMMDENWEALQREMSSLKGGDKEG